MNFDKTSVIIPFDGSKNCRRAMDFGLGLAAALGTPVRVLHVLDVIHTAIPPDRRMDLQDLDKQDDRLPLVVQTRAAVQAARELLADQPVSAEQVLLVGDPAASILEYLEDCDRPMVVMGRRGRGGLARLMLGSVSEKVVTYAHCPVMVVN